MRRLLARHNAQLPDDVRAYLHGCVSHKMAVTQGRRSTPSEYFAQYAAALDTFAPYILAKRLPGYGPLRARYGVELMRDAVPMLDTLHDLERETRAVSHGHRKAMELTDAQRANARAAFAAVLTGDEAPEASLDVAVPTTSSKHERIVAATELAAEVERVQAAVSAALLDDAGLTDAVLDGLAEQAGEASDTGAARNDKETAKQPPPVGHDSEGGVVPRAWTEHPLNEAASRQRPERPA